ncbi:class I SAM-dependent methyltransferase [Lentzea sp. NPDC042327]|uniref:class I SAM-dependent methyltransferase n=1 Tax=Lentzea sp. NPDC042327 TaxID=3154801 RepID=UPI0033E5F9C1
MSRVGRLLRTGYYTAGYGRRFPGHDRVERFVRDFEAREAKGDTPRERAAWDAQYARGEWDHLAGLGEQAYYAVIVGYGTFFAPGGSVLDVGCGEGVLHSRWLPHGYERYVGLDISEVAVRRLAQRVDERTEFRAADADTHTPDGKFDVIVFNESLYYLTDPLAALERYERALTPDGVVIVSMFLGSRRSRAILGAVRRERRVVDSTRTTQGATSWECLVLKTLQPA